MKKTISLLLTLCTLLCTLNGCHIRRDYYQSLEGDTGPASGHAERETVVEIVTNDSGEAVTTDDGGLVTEIVTQPVTSPRSDDPVEPTTGVNPYDGMTREELVDLYFDNFRALTSSRSLNTPYYYILYNGRGWIAFNKLSGDITTICKDPLCDHRDCVYSKAITSVAVSEDRIYTIQGYGDGVCLFSFDYTFNDPKLLLTWSNAEDAPSDLYYWEGKLYYKVYYLVNGETRSRVRVYDVETGKDKWLEPDETMHFDNMRVVYEGYLYYWRSENNSIWRYDLRTGEDICLLAEDDALDPAEGDLMLNLKAVLPGSRKLYIGIIGASGMENVFKDYYYDLDTKEKTRSFGSERPLGGYGISLKDHINTDDEVFKNDPFYGYYTNDFVKGIRVTLQYGGDVYYNTEDREETKRLLRGSLDGIPVGFYLGFGNDGKCLYIHFRTYKDFKNQYNPDYKDPPTATYDVQTDKWTYKTDTELYLHDGWAVVDIVNQKILTICKDNVEYEWYPDGNG